MSTYVAYINDDGLEIQDDEDDDSVDRVMYCSNYCFTSDGRTSTGLTFKGNFEPDYCEYCGHCEKLVIRGLHPYGPLECDCSEGCGGE
jgi:hypothetical protein